MANDESTLLELYRLHTDEVRFQVRLNWERAKASLAFNAGLLVAGLGLGSRLLLGFVVLSASLGAVMVHIEHGYYRHARDRRAEVEAALGVEHGFVSTRGQRGEKRDTWQGRHWPKVNSVLVLAHAGLALLALAGILFQHSQR
jgi:hypothetical protein